MPQDVRLSPGSVQETMLMPLWGRANFSRLYPQFIRDREAENIIDGLSYDFTNMSQALGEYGGIAYLVRARRFDDAIRDYIRLHPRATVVNLGSGLDTTFSRVDNGSIRWFNLDLPDSIAFRKKLIPDKERSTCIQRSAFDLKWLDEVAFEPEKGLFIIAGGLFMYFKTHQVRNLFEAISHRFQGGELYFDTLSWLGRGYVNVMLKKAGTPQMHFYVSNSRRLFSTWSTKIEVVEDIPLWYGVKRDPRWSKRTRLMMDLCDLLKTGKYIRLKFLR